MAVDARRFARSIAWDDPGRRPVVHPQHSSSDTGIHSAVIKYRLDAVERVILFMWDRLCEPISLHDMAEIALLSPYHFNRVFSSVTGLSPCRFLSALRLYEAKRLLLSTSLSVTEVCFEVGYNSLGTFTRQFTQTVGFPPRRLRHIARDTLIPIDEALSSAGRDQGSLMPAHASVSGRITGSEIVAGPIFVGLFSTSIPQGQPVRCALVSGAGSYHMTSIPDGCYHLFAAEFARSDDPLAYLLPERNTLRVGTSAGPLTVHQGRASGPTDIKLRVPQLTDPPILVALPLLLAERLELSSTGVA